MKSQEKLSNGKTSAPYALAAEDFLERMGVDIEQGLGDEAVEAARKEYGGNVLSQEEFLPWWRFFLRQFASPMVYLLFVAALISFMMGELLDSIAILVVIFMNSLIGFFTEFRAEKALQALKSMTSPHCRVLRNGNISLISSADVVPGDIMVLEAGDVIPADGRLFKEANCMVNEASLTGESLPVEKIIESLPLETLLPDRVNCVYAGTNMVKGTARAIVFATGMETEIGRIGRMLQQVSSQETPLEERLAKFSQFLIWATIAIAGIVIGAGIFQGRGLLMMLSTGIALAVAAVPEGLPFVATMTLALGVHRMAKINALVRNLASVETLGSTTVICTDKTGTLTMNDMTVRTVHLSQSEAEELFIRVAVLCNDATINDTKSVGDPMEVALLRYAGENKLSLRNKFPRIAEEPFDSQTMRMVTWHNEGVAMKGAPERVFHDCPFILTSQGPAPFLEETKIAWHKNVQVLAQRGMRTIALAWGDSLESLMFLGVAGIDDPPRPEVNESVTLCHKAGIHVIMVTGDHLVTAEAIAKEVGIYKEPYSLSMMGSELESLSEEDVVARAKKLSVVARVAPEHKMRIVKGLQKAGEVVAMTGDGVNDAVALKQADVGIAMGIQGTEVSKEASDIILQDDRFSTIVEAVREGRRIFDNIRKAVLFLLCCNLSEILTVFLGILLKLPTILIPLQILWINLVTDVLPALALSLDPAEPDVMLCSPKRRDENIVTRSHKLLIFFYGAAITSGVFAAYYWSLWYHKGDFLRATELSFHTLVLAQLFFVLNVRKNSLLSHPERFWENPWLLLGIGVSVLLQVVITYIPVFQNVLDIVPLGALEWGVVVGSALLPTGLAQLRKILFGL
ncbi:cation-translocating P-type ATPase [Aminobacterium mobile]|uniref:cation-translocating P-type ATPase n=1 Tax=Aminobacterium mobile TaxID=81467 RepID=UPI000467271F|nr:cation-translocating P-type ATPase [Aminobacterium mobile]